MNKDSKNSKTIICHDKKGQAHEHKVSELKFRPGVYGILIEDNKILLSKQYDGYDFPGGGIDIDETIAEALKREFFEETGLSVEKDQLVDVIDVYFYSMVYKEPWHSIQIFYTCKKVGGELSIDHIDDHEKDYIEMPEWVDLAEVNNLKFYNQVDAAGLIKKAAKMT